MNVIPYANSLFEQPWWLDIVAPGNWHEAVLKDENGNVNARLPYVLSGHRVTMPPLTQNLGIWMTDSIRGDYGAQKKAIFELFAQLPGGCSISHSLSPANQYVLPFRWLGCQLEPRFTYRLTDLQNSEKLYQQFSKTAKKNIKYAKNKVTLSDRTDVDTLLDLLDKTFAAQNRKNPMPKDLIRKIVQVCDETGHGKYVDARDPEGNVHACAYFVYDEQVCYYLMGASDSAYRSSGAQSLILWEGIQFAALHSRVFDFEGSMIEGIENFFRQFGGECTPYYEIKKSNLLHELVSVFKPRLKKLLGYKM